MEHQNSKKDLIDMDFPTPPLLLSRSESKKQDLSKKSGFGQPREEKESDPQKDTCSCFRIFTFFNIFISLILGISCLTLYPDLYLYSVRVYIMVCLYMGIEIFSFIFSVMIIGTCWLIGYLIPRNRQCCSIGWFPLLYESLINVSYLIYIPIGGKILYDYGTALPILVIIYFVYIIFVSIIFLMRATMHIIDKNIVSPHIMEIEDIDVHKVDEQQLEKYKNEIITARN